MVMLSVTEGDRVHWKETNSVVKMNGVKITSRKLRETWVLSPWETRAILSKQTANYSLSQLAFCLACCSYWGFLDVLVGILLCQPHRTAVLTRSKGQARAIQLDEFLGHWFPERNGQPLTAWERSMLPRDDNSLPAPTYRKRRSWDTAGCISWAIFVSPLIPNHNLSRPHTRHPQIHNPCLLLADPGTMREVPWNKAQGTEWPLNIGSCFFFS